MSDISNFRKFISIPEDQIEHIHGISKPAEVYETDNIFVTLKPIGATAETKFKVYRISPMGIEIEIPKTTNQEILQTIRPGAPVDLALFLGSLQSMFHGLIITSHHKEGDHDLAGIRFVDLGDSTPASKEQRNSFRWLCGSEFLPTGIAPNPARYNDYIYFRVRDFSKEGLHLTTSLRNKFIVKGMILEATVSFPMVGQAYIPFRIENCRISRLEGKDYLSIGAKILDISPSTYDIMGQYALQFACGANVQNLKREGFSAKYASNAFEYSFVKTIGDYEEVLKLRSTAYGLAGKMELTGRIEDAGDIFDTRARILMVKHFGKLVGSMRIMFHTSDDLMEHEQFLTLPQDFPKKHEIAEVTRICTHPDYRGSDLFYSLIKYMVLIPAQGKKRWILGSATKKLLPLYMKIGFRPLELTYKHATLGNQEHVLMIIDVPQLISGVGISPVMWKKLYSDMKSYLVHQHDFQVTPLANLRMAIYELITPLFQTISIRKVNE